MIARRLVPGRMHAVTRRAARRCFFLRPSDEVNEIVKYALGYAIQKHGVDVFAFMAASNHTHLDGIDGDEASSLPPFFRDFHSLVARALNAHYGRGENLWRPGSYDNAEITDCETLEEQLLYTWTNPVKDGLVARPEDWPGVRFLPEDLGRTFVVPRPAAAFFGGMRPDDWEPSYPPAREAHRHRSHRR